VPAGHTFTPGGVSTAHVKVIGTMNGGSNLHGFRQLGFFQWHLVGEYQHGQLTGTGTVVQYMAANPWSYGFNNLRRSCRQNHHTDQHQSVGGPVDYGQWHVY
jgi:hypothetical protein